MLIEMKVTSLLVDQESQTCVVILQRPAGAKQSVLLIWIGLLEASAIASTLKQLDTFHTLMMHNLMKTLLNNLNVEVNRIEISNLRNYTHYATIYLSMNRCNMTARTKRRFLRMEDKLSPDPVIW
jgi:bifunctional DNase/RNase